jgi:hypothetical protein
VDFVVCQEQTKYPILFYGPMKMTRGQSSSMPTVRRLSAKERVNYAREKSAIPFCVMAVELLNLKDKAMGFSRNLVDCLCYYLVIAWPKRWFSPDCKLLMWAWSRAHDWAYRDFWNKNRREL